MSLEQFILKWNSNLNWNHTIISLFIKVFKNSTIKFNNLLCKKKKDSGTNITTDSPPRAGVYEWLGCFQIRNTPWRGWTFRTSGGWGPCPDRGCQSKRQPPPDDHTWSGRSPGPDPAESSRAASPWHTEEKRYKQI